MLGGLLGGLIGGIGSWLTGDANRDAAQQANREQIAAIERANQLAFERENTRIQRLVRDANKAGIHPLAALGSPVVSGFATPQAAYGGAPISGDGVGDALQSIGAAFPQSDGTMEKLQQQLLTAQIRNVDASTANMLSEAQSRTITANNRTPYTLFGQQIEPSPYMSDAQTLANRHGEAVDWMSWILTVPADVIHNAPDLSASARAWIMEQRANVQEQMRARGATVF